MNNTSRFRTVWKRVRRIVIATVGFSILALGIALIFLPGPAFIFIPLGLAILALEFPWARRALDRFRSWLNKRSPKR